MRMQKGRGMGKNLPRAQRACLWAGWVAALAFAMAWVGLHLSWQPAGQEARLGMPLAAQREEQAMPVTWPAGEIFLNQATLQELCQLQGIGETLAQAIVAEREAHGPFYFPEDLRNIKGIGQKKLNGFLAQTAWEP